MNTPLPPSITLAGKRLKVVYKDLGNNLGFYEHDKGEIQLHTCYKDKGSPEAWLTLQHEMVHASLAIGGVSFVLNEEAEEAVVRNIEQLLIPALWEL